MNRDKPLSSLSVGELIALIDSLQQQLIEKDREIARLVRLLPSEPENNEAEGSTLTACSEAAPGSVDDLLAQLEQIYPKG